MRNLHSLSWCWAILRKYPKQKTGWWFRHSTLVGQVHESRVKSLLSHFLILIHQQRFQQRLQLHQLLDLIHVQFLSQVFPSFSPLFQQFALQRWLLFLQLKQLRQLCCWQHVQPILKVKVITQKHEKVNMNFLNWKSIWKRCHFDPLC